MPTPSPKLGLALPAQTDPFSTADIRANWSKIDAAPGTHICTSTTRPTLTSAQAGRRILEIDTGLEWYWTGTEFRRMNASGLLKRTDGSWAIGERATNFSTGSSTYIRVLTLSSVRVPAGNRPLRVDASWQKAYNSAGAFKASIYRSNTDASGPLVARWDMGSGTSESNAGGGTFSAFERNGLAAGTYDFSFQINAPSGTSTITSGTLTPLTLAVTEL